MKESRSLGVPGGSLCETGGRRHWIIGSFDGEGKLSEDG
jgi:hypothetical protein